MPVVRRLAPVFLGGFALAAVLGFALAPVVYAQDDAGGLEQMLTRINQMRSAAGVGTLARDARLDAAAQAHSTDMAANDLLAHVSPRTGDPNARVAAAGITGVQIAENIALNADVLAAHGALVGSEAHRANLMNPALTHIGLAAARSARGVYVTQVFATLVEASAAQAAAPPPPVVAPSVAALPAPVPAPAEVAPETAQVAAAALLPSEAVALPQVTAPVTAGGRRVAGYWVLSQGRWWYYPLPADARPGQALQAASLPPGAAPPGYSQQGTGAPLPVYSAPVYAPRTWVQQRVYAPPPAAYYPPAGGAVYYAPGTFASPPPPFGGWSPRRRGGHWRH